MRNALLAATLLLGCGGTAVKPGTTTVISLVDIGCASCGAGAVARLTATPEVYEVHFDRTSAELTIRYDAARVDPQTLAKRIQDELGFTSVVGAGKGRYEASPTWNAQLDMKEISAGEVVDLEKHVVPGKVTVFDYHAAWCKPCRDVDRALLELAKEMPDLAIRKLNMVDWNSPLAKKHLHGVKELPYVVVHGPDGRYVDTIVGLDLKRLRDTIARARTL